jgi:hypothetical protein
MSLKFDAPQENKKNPQKKEVVYEIDDIKKSIEKLKEILVHPCDPILRFKKRQAEPESIESVLARINKKISGGGDDFPKITAVEPSYEMSSEELNKTPEYKNKYRTRWFTIALGHLQIILDSFDYEDLLDVFAEVRNDVHDHNQKFEKIKQKYNEGEFVEDEESYELYLTERKNLIDRIDQLIVEVTNRSEKDLESIVVYEEK